MNFHLIDLNNSFSNHPKLSSPLLTQFIFPDPQTPPNILSPYTPCKILEISPNKYPPNLSPILSSPYPNPIPPQYTKIFPIISTHLSSWPQLPAESQSSWTLQISWPLRPDWAWDLRILPILSLANYPTSLLCLKNNPLVSFKVNIKAFCWTPCGLVRATCVWGLESLSLIVVASPFGL